MFIGVINHSQMGGLLLFWPHYISGWWCNNHLEQWWSSSMGRMTSHIWNGNIKNDGTHQPDMLSASCDFHQKIDGNLKRSPIFNNKHGQYIYIHYMHYSWDTRPNPNHCYGCSYPHDTIIVVFTPSSICGSNTYESKLQHRRSIHPAIWRRIASFVELPSGKQT